MIQNVFYCVTTTTKRIHTEVNVDVAGVAGEFEFAAVEPVLDVRA